MLGFIFNVIVNIFLARLIYLNLSFAQKFVQFALEYCGKYIPLEIKVDRFSNFLVIIILTIISLSVIKILFAGFVALSSFFSTKKYVRSLEIVSQHNDLVIFKSDEPLAFVSGIIHKKIYISSWFKQNSSKEEFNLTLEHEKAHLRNNDYVKRLSLQFFLNSFLIFPFRSIYYKNFTNIQEINSDIQIIKSPTDLKRLCKLLYKSAKVNKYIQVDEILPAFVTNISRIDALLNKQTYKNSITFIFLMFTLLFIAAFALTIFTLFASKEVSADVIGRYPSLQSRDLSSCVEENYSDYYKELFTPAQ